MLLAQDLFVLLKLACLKNSDWTYRSLADELHLSVSQVHSALKRAASGGLYSVARKVVNRPALEEFLVHGVKYAYPAEKGMLTHGLVTAYAAPPLNKIIVSSPDEPAPVWSYAHGNRIGYSIKPLHPSAPVAAQEDPAFYELLALVDAIREGRARERTLAQQELHKRLKSKND
jgi:hypothetical protein